VFPQAVVYTPAMFAVLEAAVVTAPPLTQDEDYLLSASSANVIQRFHERRVSALRSVLDPIGITVVTQVDWQLTPKFNLLHAEVPLCVVSSTSEIILLTHRCDCEFSQEEYTAAVIAAKGAEHKTCDAALSRAEQVRLLAHTRSSFTIAFIL
jgi:hypothetical protein